MTFKDLVINNTFGSLIPYLIEIDNRCKGSLEAFESAYNLILKMDVVNDGKTVSVMWSDPDDEEAYIRVTNLHDGEWEECIGRELKVDENVNLTDAALCAHCLWEITFWGFSPDDEAEHFRKMLNRS